MCEETREELVRVNYLEKYRFAQIRAKYGILRLYDFGASLKFDEVQTTQGFAPIQKEGKGSW